MNIGGIFGLIDIIIIVLALLFMFIGWKKGFSKKLISIPTILIFIGVSFIFCGSLAELLLKNNLGNFMKDPLYEQLSTVQADSYSSLLKDAFGFWDILADWISKPLTTNCGEFSSLNDPALSVAEYITKMGMSAICFIAIFIGIIIIASILRGIARHNQKVGFIRFVDGLLGMVFYLALLSVVVCVLFYALNKAIDQSWFGEAKVWFIEDMKLDTNEFRISKIIYNGNVVQRVIDWII